MIILFNDNRFHRFERFKVLQAENDVIQPVLAKYSYNLFHTKTKGSNKKKKKTEEKWNSCSLCRYAYIRILTITIMKNNFLRFLGKGLF